MKTTKNLSRRTVLKTIGAASVAMAGLDSSPVQAKETEALPPSPPAHPRSGDIRKEIFDRVFKSPLVDTHEHLIEESQRLEGARPSLVPCDDWALLLSHYLNSDLLTAGMPTADMDRFLSPKMDPLAKWKLLAPYWPAVKNTGYGQAVRIAMRELYDAEELSEATVAKVQSGYERVRRAGFYRAILRDRAGLDSCQVNCLTGEPFKQSEQPLLLMQDLSIVGMFSGPSIQQYAKPAGMAVKDLSDWHQVIKWWFDRYGQYAVAVKSQNAYGRDIDYERVPAERAEPVFKKVLNKEPVTAGERKLLEDHLFWHTVDCATAHSLPIKLHTGYYAGQNSMPLSRLLRNPGSATELCRLAPEARFVFMHICYPHYEEILSVAKQYTNAHVDMCWSWIINPLAAKDYLKKHIVTAPINKLLPFGGDYIPVEPVLGHAMMARRGIAQALAELVEEDWLKPGDALELVDMILHQNARRIFRLDEKRSLLSDKSQLEKAGWKNLQYF